MHTFIPEVEVYLGGRTLEEWGLQSFLSSVSVTRIRDKTRPGKKNKGMGRNIRSSGSIVLENVDSQLWSAVRIRERMEIHLGYHLSRLYLRGTFVTTNPAFTLPSASGMTIRIKGEDQAATMARDERPRSVGNRTVEDVAKEIAHDHGLKLRIDPSIGRNIVRHLVRKSPGYESDWLFLEALVHKVGAHLMYVEPGAQIAPGGGQGTLVIEPFKGVPLILRGYLPSGEVARDLATRAGEGDENAAQELQHLMSTRGERVASIGYRKPADYWFKELRVTLSGEESDIQTGETLDISGNKVVVNPVNGEPFVLEARKQENMENEGGASNAGGGSTGGTASRQSIPKGMFSVQEFTTSMDLWNAYKTKIVGELQPAIPFLLPGHIIELRGAGPFSGHVLITEVTDNWGRSGYAQSIVMRSTTWLSDDREDAAEVRKRVGTTLVDGTTNVLEARPEEEIERGGN